MIDDSYEELQGLRRAAKQWQQREADMTLSLTVLEGSAREYARLSENCADNIADEIKGVLDRWRIASRVALLLLWLLVPVRASAASIVLILADDMRVDDVAHMPTLEQLAAQGTSFDLALAPFALCTPARTSLLTGMTPSRHGIYENDASLFDPTWPTLGTRLRAAGYRTALIGKVFNKMRLAPWARLPGWDTYQALEKHSDFGAEQSHVLANRAARFLRSCSRDGVDCFLYVSPASPHGPNPGPPECVGPWPAPPPSLTDTHLWNRRMSSLCGLDGLVDKVVRSAPVGTTFVFLSDQGFALGENASGEEDDDARMGKQQMLIDAMQFPLLVWGPGVERSPHRREIVSTMDVTATVLDLAGVDQAGVDGKSLVPLTRGRSPEWGGELMLEGR